MTKSLQCFLMEHRIMDLYGEQVWALIECMYYVFTKLFQWIYIGTLQLSGSQMNIWDCCDLLTCLRYYRMCVINFDSSSQWFVVDLYPVIKWTSSWKW